MEHRFIYLFEKHGQVQPAANPLPQEVWLDVGNALGRGSFDHHTCPEYHSSFSALLNNKQYLDPLMKESKKRSEILIHIHKRPDLDCVFSVFAVQHYLQHPPVFRRNADGQEEAAYKPLCGKEEIENALREFVDDIDGGKGKTAATPTLYALFSNLSRRDGDSEAEDSFLLEQGLQLVQCAVDLLHREPDADLRTYDLSVLPKIQKCFAKEISLINEAGKNYFRDIAQKRAVAKNITLYDSDGKLAEVPAMIWTELPTDGNSYILAREEGNILTMVPKSIRGQNGAETTRVIIALRPPEAGEKSYSLKPIAEVLEQMEQIEEQRQYEQTGFFRRDHSRSRADEGPLKLPPFAATSDPWYISPVEDIIDVPRDGSMLDYQDILAVVRNNAFQMYRGFCLNVDTGEITKQKSLPLSTWQAQVHKSVSKDGFHLVFAQMNSALIRRSSRILEAYCVNLTGRSFHEADAGHFLHPDYKTCIYADLNTVVILTATPAENAYSELPISSVLQPDAQELSAEPLAAAIAAARRQRMTFLDYCSRIGNQSMSRREAEQLYSEILSFLGTIQTEDAQTNPLTRDVYQFLKREFEIETLKASVLEEMNLLIGERRNKMVARFNFLSALAVPLVVIGTVFQMGILQFEPLMTLDGSKSLLGWSITLLITAALTALLSLHRRKRENKKKK